jgi:hypothetical protein
MHIPKKYFQDRLILLLLSVNTFFALFSSVWVLLQMDSGRTGNYITSINVNQAITTYGKGSVLELLAFIVFAAFVLSFHTVLSIKTYTARRQFSITILGLGFLLLILGLLVGSSLLGLR